MKFYFTTNFVFIKYTSTRVSISVNINAFSKQVSYFAWDSQHKLSFVDATLLNLQSKPNSISLVILIH